MFEQILHSACDFVSISLIFPFILIFVFAGVCALIVLGLTLFINGLKTKWAEINTPGRIFKIVKIVVGVILLIIALLTIAYVTAGFVVLIQNGGFFGSGNKAN